MANQSNTNIVRAEKRGFPLETARSLPLVAVCYPNSYAVGMSNLAFHFLLRLLSRASVRLERAFALPQAWEHRGCTFESGARLSTAAVILATVSYEEDYPNLVALLEASGIPLHAAERRPEDPVVIAGGSAVSANPAVPAQYCDALAIGEFEDAADVFAAAAASYAHGRIPRREFLARLAEQGNVLVPSIHGAGADGAAAGFSRIRTGFKPVASEIISPFSHFPDTVLIEINRSCVSSCRFCLASRLYKPFRIADRGAILDVCERWKGKAGSVGLVGTAVTSYPKFEELCEAIRSRGFSVQLSSLRLEGMTRSMLEFIAGLGIRTITFAPETLNEALRRGIGKRFANEEIEEVLSAVRELPFKKVKLYFMYGIPGERENDLDALAAFVGNMRKRLGSVRLDFSVNCLVRNHLFCEARTQGDAAPRFEHRGAVSGCSVSRRVGSRRRSRRMRSFERGGYQTLAVKRRGSREPVAYGEESRLRVPLGYGAHGDR
ncbi:MAG: radical SAM protein [Chitinivibrionia bacterium]|nr:radical SAM protein [Chitinivibrionia bacterium]